VPTFVRNAGEVYRKDERLPAPDPFARHLAYLMDGVIPIGRWSVGIDPLLGLVPGIGDLIGAAIAMIIVFRAVQAGIPRIAVARMMTNIAIDTFVGSIPVVGDAFDFAYKSNLKNLRIYEDALRAPSASTARHWGFFLGMFLLGALVVALIVIALLSLFHRTSTSLV
jgi:hypothetical protein